MNKTPTELNSSVIHSIIEVCQDQQALSTQMKLNRRCERTMLVGIRVSLKRLMTRCVDKVKLSLSTGRITLIPTQAEQDAKSLRKPRAKCLWHGGEARMPIGKVVSLSLSEVFVGRQSSFNGEKLCLTGIITLAKTVLRAKPPMPTILNQSLTIQN